MLIGCNLSIRLHLKVECLMDAFKFKKFQINHDKCAMKIGTDGMLLGAWVDVTSAERILDVGTGSGIIAIMCAQRKPDALIWGVDIDEMAVCQARENVAMSPYSENININITDYRKFTISGSSINGLFTHIVSNPPFFTENTTSPDKQRSVARNSNSLPFEDLLGNSSKMLCDGGRLSIVVPSSLTKFIVSCAAKYSLFLCRRTDVADSPSACIKRSLLEFTYNIIQQTEHDLLIIHDENGGYSSSYRRLMADFLLL